MVTKVISLWMILNSSNVCRWTPLRSVVWMNSSKYEMPVNNVLSFYLIIIKVNIVEQSHNQ